ncbi:MAG TPA: RAMP superfamily CRISPR-associated protein [Clostridia bacterium]|nr:RAMP superfamily CRISPR-associated protein [Clostridia bacterium]
MKATYNCAAVYLIDISSKSIFRTAAGIGGNRDDLLRDDNGNIIIQGTGIAGAMREYASFKYDSGKVSELFGSSSTAKGSCLVFSDAVTGGVPKTEIRPGIAIDPVTMTTIDHSLFHTGFVSAGTSFKLHIYIYSLDFEKLKIYCDIVENCLRALDTGEITLGGRTTTGAGVFRIERADKRLFDLSDTTSRHDWYRNDYSKTEPVDIKSAGTTGDFIRIILKAHTRGTLLIKGQNLYETSSDDSTHIRDSAGRLLIPGSSLKGVLRNHAAKVLEEIGRTDLLTTIFGSNRDLEERQKGLMEFSDSIIENVSTHSHKRIHIDKFTSGVMNGALFSQEQVNGETKLVCSFGKTGDSHTDNSIIGLLLLLARDLAFGEITLGGSTSIGYGVLEGEEIVLENGEVIEKVLCSDLIDKSPEWAGQYISELWGS